MILMYHSITSADDAHPVSAFHRSRYTVTDEALRDHANHCRSGQVTFTFDDGHASIHERAFPILANRIPMIIFVSTGFIGQSDWLTPSHIREMHRAGVQISAHGHLHRGFSSLPHDILKEELTRSKGLLEDIVGAKVSALSLVGGHYNRHVLNVARELGYRTIYSSHPVCGITAHGLLGRICIYNHTDLQTFQAICRGAVPLRMRWSYHLKDPVKRVLAWYRRITPRSRVTTP